MDQSSKKNSGIVPVSLAVLVLSAIYMAGIFTFLRGCGPKDDGSFMTCHWAEMSLKGLSAVLTMQSVILLCSAVKGLASGYAALMMVPVSLLNAVLPGNLIPLCMMDAMRCRSIMTPAARIFGILIAALALLCTWKDRYKKA